MDLRFIPAGQEQDLVVGRQGGRGRKEWGGRSRKEKPEPHLGALGDSGDPNR